MTSEEIRATITTDPELLALVRRDGAPFTEVLALHAVFATHMVVADRWLTDIGLIGELLPRHGPEIVESILGKLKALAQTSEIVEAARNKLRLGAGLNFGDPSTRAQIVALGKLPQGGFTAAEVSALLALGERPAPVSEFEIRCAIYADDGSLLV